MIKKLCFVLLMFFAINNVYTEYRIKHEVAVAEKTKAKAEMKNRKKDFEARVTFIKVGMESMYRYRNGPLRRAKIEFARYQETGNEEHYFRAMAKLDEAMDKSHWI